MNNESSPVKRGSREAIVLALLTWQLALVSSVASATTYFVDANHPNARDLNPGTEAQPFKTIGRATGVVNAGDTVFIKAGVYREAVILSRSGSSLGAVGRTGPISTAITWAVYPGHEGKTIINAAEPIVRWRKCTSPQECAGNLHWEHLYSADVAALVQAHPDTSFAVRQVFQHGKLLPRSRYPDTRWSYPTRMPDPLKSFTDDTLSQPDGYFTGAVCHIRTRDWQIDPIPITSFANTTITLSKSPRYAITTRYGYYITSIVGEINAEGEWAYDPAQKKIYVWPRGDVPDGIEFSYREYCVRSNAGTACNVLRGLTLRYAYTHALWLYQSNGMIVEDNTVEYGYGTGIHVQAGEGAGDRNQIRHNTVRYCASRGIDVDARSSHTTVEGNYVYATGTNTYGGDLMNGQSQAIYISGPYTRVYNNRVDRTGYSALYVSGKTLGRDISYNYVTNVGFALADGGGLYTGGYSDVAEKDHIHHNIFADAFGCRSMDRNYDNGQAPTSSTYSGLMHGIYVDEEGNNRIIEYNTAINCSRGLHFHWAPSNVIQKNTFYGNRAVQVMFQGKNAAKTMLVNDALVDNILFATGAGRRTLELNLDYDNVRFGLSDRNYFYHPYDDQHIYVERRPASGSMIKESLSLAGWQALSGYDGHSKDFFSLKYKEGITLAEPYRLRIVYNATLEVKTVDLGGDKYCEVDGRPVSGVVILQPFESKVLIALAEPGGANHR